LSEQKKNIAKDEPLFREGVLPTLIAELLFILLPFVVSGIVFSYKGTFTRLLYMSEWSLAASVLFGQGLVKYVSGILHGVIATEGRGKISREVVAVMISITIVFGLVPSLLVLSLVLIADEPSRGLAVAQLILFILGLLAYFLLAGIGEDAMRLSKIKKAEASAKA